MKKDCCDMFKVLGVATRVKIIELLRSKGPLGAKRMADELGVTPAAVSQHLRVLKLAGLVSSQRRGYFIPYSLDPRGLERCGRELAAVCVCDCETSAPAPAGGGKKDVGSLLAYKRQLEKELEKVKRRIAVIERRGKR